jgi:hypothetical protein
VTCPNAVSSRVIHLVFHRLQHNCFSSLDSIKLVYQHPLERRSAATDTHAFNCMLCNRRFNSDEALQLHLQYSPAHAPSFDCDDCDRSFDSEEALQQYLRDSPIYQQDTETLLDVFFYSFLTFDYDPSLPPATSYADLRRHKGWHRGSAASDDAWNRYQDALYNVS